MERTEVIVEDDEFTSRNGASGHAPALDWRSRKVAVLGQVTPEEHQAISEAFDVSVDDPHVSIEVDSVDADVILLARICEAPDLVAAFRRTRVHRYTPVLVLYEQGEVPGIETAIAISECAPADLVTQLRSLLWIGQAWALSRMQILSSTEAMVVVDQQHRIYLLNPAAERLFGYLSVEIQDRPLSELLEIPLAPQGLSEREYRGFKRDGTSFFTAVSQSPVLFQEGTFTNLVVRDITLQKELERERAKALHSSRLAAIGEMVSFVAHEINTPLSVINGRVKLLRGFLRRAAEGASPASCDEHVDSIERMVTRIDTIVRNTLHLARSGEQDPMEPASLLAIVRDTLNICEAAFAKAHIEITVEVGEELQVQCRAVQISQVVLNLLTNALDAIRSAEDLAPERRWVRIVSELHEGRILLRVSNGGPPIPPQVKRGLFVETATTKKVGMGTGLGLRVSKSIMEAHGGDLALDEGSEDTCFLLVLPAL